MYILTAAQSYQAALETTKLGHGYLTYALVEEGLKQGMADREPKDQKIVLREWLDYATEQVPRLQEAKLKEQPKRSDRRGKRSLSLSSSKATRASKTQRSETSSARAFSIVVN